MGQATFTQTKDPIQLPGTNRLLIGNLTMSNSYATGGDTAPTFNVGNVPADGSIMIGGHGSGGIALEYVAGKIKAYRQKDPAAAGGADIALPEVANAVDLSAVSVECWATVST